MELAQLASTIIIFAVLLLVKKDSQHALWPKFRDDRTFQHLTYFVMLGLFLLWSAQASVKEGLTIHFLALTTLTMMYGWRSAFIITIPVTAALALFGKISLAALPEYLLLSSLLPILISYSVFALSYHYLPRNIFVFIFVAGFFNAGVTGSLHLLLNSLYVWEMGTYDWKTIMDNYLIFIHLLAFPEGLLNGMALAILAVFRPEWLRVFSDRDYLYNHYHRH
ncbi:energy-coupling factor ABC transporter permease [Vibrio metoecus]|uniref:energy-coupling factor ABC transporter permease n=1 Tax=Vibrio metoecus TaxID=1481663 RepID=UPI002729DDDE|nr:energy-coupling factor ABC transporter permease [Vibrio metoecus]WKY94052.1 energy-coupling factor ABC transporter permease [Vibrio metoecus]